MQVSLIALLIVLSIWAVVSYRLGFQKPPRFGRTRLQAAFLVLVFILIPFVVLVLRQQAGAEQALAEHGIVPHPALTETSGVAAGTFVAGDQIWIFHADERPGAILDFYRNPETRSDWQLSTDSPVMLILRRGSQRLTIAANENATGTVVMFSLGGGGDRRE